MPLTVLEALAAELPVLYTPLDFAQAVRQGSPVATATIAAYHGDGHLSRLPAPQPQLRYRQPDRAQRTCCPPTDGDYVRPLVRYAIATGFLPSEGVPSISARPDSADPGSSAARPPKSR